MPNTNDVATDEMTAGTSVPAALSPVADTMRRVQAQLRRGAAPSFEALLAFGEPTVR